MRPVVTDRVACRFVTVVSPAKMAEPIEIPFGLWARMGPRNHVLDGGADPSMGRGNYEGGKGRAVVKYMNSGHSAMSCAKTA